MSQSPEQNVNSWNKHQVKYWLELKGMSIEIQNTFYNQGIDGEALLYLREKDIEEKLCPPSINFGIRRKLATYIGQLQTLNNKPAAANPIGNIHSSSLSPQINNYIFK